MQNPAVGEPAAGAMNDRRWHADEGWVKLQQNIKPGGSGGPITVHYNYNPITDMVDDFKIVYRTPGTILEYVCGPCGQDPQLVPIGSLPK